MSGNASAVVVGDAVYVLVQDASWRPSGQGGFLRYRIADDAWDQLPAPEPGTSWFRLAATESAVVAFSGSDEHGERPDLIFDARTDAWEPLPADPLSPSFDRTMVAVGAGLYLFAKDLVANPGSEQPALVRAARFDLSSGEWELRADSEILGGWSAVALGTEIVFPESGSADGGQVNNWGRSFPVGGLYDTERDEWSTLPEPAHDHSFSIAGALGAGSATYVGDSGHVFHADTREWIAVPDPPTTRDNDEFNRTVVAAGTDLFIFGGESWDGSVGTVLGEAYVWSPTS